MSGCLKKSKDGSVGGVELAWRQVVGDEAREVWRVWGGQFYGALRPLKDTAFPLVG